MTPLHQMQLDVPPPPRLIMAEGAAMALGDIVRRLGAGRAFLISDPGLVKAGLVDAVGEALTNQEIEVITFTGVEPNPTVANIEAGSKALAAAGEAVVISLGGGSAMDAAKGIVLHVTNPGPVTGLDYSNPLVPARHPVIAIPTTAGTGAETNGFGVISNPETHRKFYVGHDSAQADVCVLDPALTAGLPAPVTAATGMDALTHALEAYSSRFANPYGDALALQGVRTVFEYLPRAVANGNDMEARAQMLLAAHTVMLGYRSGTGLGMAHAIGHSLGGRLHVPHGLALAAILPEVLRFNLPVCTEKYARAAFTAGLGDTSKDDEANANAFIDGVAKLSAQVSTNVPLGTLGVSAQNIPMLVQDTLTDVVLGPSPRQPTADEVGTLLATLI